MSRNRKTPAEMIAAALAAHEAGFATKVAKTDAMGLLSSVYGSHREAIMGLCLDHNTENARMTPAMEEIYWGLPNDLHNYRAKHTAMVVKVFPQMAATCAEMERLVELRKTLNAAEVAPKAPSKAQREESIRLSATGKVYAEEFGKLAPELAKDYEENVEHAFRLLADRYGLKMVELLGTTYRRRSDIPEGVREFDIETFQNRVRPYVSANTAKGPQLDAARLRKHAAEYAEGQIKQFVVKLTQKLGDLTDVRIVRANGHRFECLIEGNLRGHKVSVKQSAKFVINGHGTAFHQWPALIYVDGKFTTETAFKRLVLGA